MRVSTGGVGRGWLFLLVVVVMLGTVAPTVPSAGATSPTQGTTVESWNGAVPLQVITANESNQTHHENPEKVSESGDLSQVRGWLAGRMGETLVNCTESLQNPALTVACERSNEEYPDWLGMYVDTVRATASESDDATADTFRDANEHQQAFREQVQRFRETRREYEQARESGNTDLARRKARELLRISRNVAQTGTALRDDYRALSAATGLQLNDSAQTVATIENETAQTAESVRADLFVETNVGVVSATESISFLDPLRVRGRLTSENGSALRNRPISLAVGSKTVRARTDENGDFTVTYRPTTLPLNATRVELTYVPRNDSVFLGSVMTVPVDVDQVNATITTTVSPESAGFGDEVSVSGGVLGGEIGAEGVPVVVTAGGQVLGRTTTNDDGQYDVRADVPAAVPPGTQSVTARIALSERALAADSAATSFDVESTPTTLSVEGTAAGGREVRVSGRLTTFDGAVVSGQRVRLVVGESQQTRTLQTDGNGAFVGTVQVPPSAFDGDANATVPVTVVFEGEGTNLEGSTAETTVRVENTTGGESGGEGTGGSGTIQGIARQLPGGSVAPWALGVVLVGLFATGWYYRARVDESGKGESEKAGRDDDEQSDTSAHEVSTPVEPAAPDALELAREQLDTGEPNESIALSYSTARARLGNELESPSAQTHWEFYTACRDVLGDSRLDDLRELTEIYERAAFAGITVSPEDAERALTAAERLRETEFGPS